MTGIEVAEIERACERLVVGYTHRVDFGAAESVAELFAPDAVWEAGTIRFEGREALPVTCTAVIVLFGVQIYRRCAHAIAVWARSWARPFRKTARRQRPATTGQKTQT